MIGADAVREAVARVVGTLDADVEAGRSRRYVCGACLAVVITRDLDAARARHAEQARRGLIGCCSGDGPWYAEVLAST